MRLLRWIGWTVAVLLCLYMGWNALLYLHPGFSGPDFIMHNAMAHPWLYLHAVFAAAALLLGPVQFVRSVRTRFPKAHRWMGRAYIVSVLISGVAGLLLAGGTVAGPVAMVGFGALAVTSMVCAVQAWRLAMARRIEAHKRWVVRSYALIFAGVTLRLWLPLSMIAGLDFMESYRVIAWLAWVPNLLLAELYLARMSGKRAGAVMSKRGRRGALGQAPLS